MTESSTWLMARCLALGSASICCICCAIFGCGPRLPALRVAGMPISSSIDTFNMRATVGSIAAAMLTSSRITYQPMAQPAPMAVS